MRGKLTLLVPVFNEEEVIEKFYQEVRSYPELCQLDLEILFVNDGSSDQSALVIQKLIEQDPKVKLMNLSRNFGKESALLAGLSVIDVTQAGAVVPIDADLQDPLQVVIEMLAKYQGKVKMVLAKRVDRGNDTLLKRLSAKWFYKIFNQLSECPIEENVGDFRLIDHSIVKVIQGLPERNLFMKGLFSWPGFKTEIVSYTRPARAAGQTKFNFFKLWNLAIEGLTSFSTMPLKVWTYAGLLIALCSFGLALWMVIEKIFWGNPVPGYPSLIVAILFLGGVQLLGIGILGEYIGRIYFEAKQRPRFVVESLITHSDLNSVE